MRYGIKYDLIIGRLSIFVAIRIQIEPRILSWTG